MEFNLHQLNFDKSNFVVSLVFCIVAPLPALILIYDSKLFFEADIFKILLAAVATGAIHYQFHVFLYALILPTGLELPGEFSIPQLGAFSGHTTVISVVIINMIKLKFFDGQSSLSILHGSFKTWILVEIIMLILVAFAAKVLKDQIARKTPSD